MEIKVVESLDGFNIPKINKNNKWIHLTSLYNTKREIDKLAKLMEKYNLSDTTILFGISNLEYINYIKRFINGDFYIVEPITELRELAVNNLSKNIKVLSVEEVCDLAFVNKIKDKTVNFLSYGAYPWVFRDEFNKLSNKLRENVVYTQVIENTRNHFLNIWIKTFFENLPYILSSESIDKYKNKHVNKPVIIVSAGPSLEKSIPILKKVHENFIIVSGGRTLKTLKNNGIHCDYTCVIDAGEPSYDVIKEALDYDTTLVYSDITNVKILKEFKGNKIYFNTNETNFIRKKLLDDCENTIYTGSSVAHASMGFSMLLGCNPIIFIGQDLAYTNNKKHADIASIVSEEENKTNDSSLKVKNVFGEDIPTATELLGFLRELEFMIKNFGNLYPNLKFINCSEGGAKIEGADYQDFNDVVSVYNTPIRGEEINTFDNVNLDKILEVIIKINNCLNEMNKGEKYLTKYKETIKNSINSIDEYSELEFNKVIFDIRKIGKRIDSTYLSEIVKYFNVNNIYKFEKIDYAGDKDEVKRTFNNILSNVKKFESGIDLLKDEMNKCILNLKEVLENE